MSDDLSKQFEAVQALVQVGDKDGAATQLTAIQDDLATRQDLSGMVACLIRRERLLKDQDVPTTRDLLKKAAKPDQKALLEQMGLGLPGVTLGEALRRIEFLLQLVPGTPVLDPSWGFGVVKRVDLFYGKLTFDYLAKAGHIITFATAAESLKLAPEDHILTRNHRDRAGIQTMIKESPGELLKLTLRCFGAQPVTKIEEILCVNGILARADWKGFWESARKALKNDPLVTIPVKRSEPVTLHASAQAFDKQWLATLKTNRDLKKIYQAVTAYADEIDGATVTSAFSDVITERLAFALKGADNTDAALYASFALLARRLKLQPLPEETLRSHLMANERLLAATDVMGATLTHALLIFLLEDAANKPVILAMLPQMTLVTLGETLTVLKDDTDTRATCVRLLQAAQTTPTLLVWALRNYEICQEEGWHLPPLLDLLLQALFVIEKKLNGEALRMRNTLQQFFDSQKWLEAIWQKLDAFQRQMVYERIQASPSWDAMSHRTLLARLVRLEPALAKGKKVAATGHEQRRTSWHSLAEYQAAHERLVKVDMPRNANDIAVARELGDLRENFEYQSAKDQQRMLLARQAQMDADLKMVRGTDFADARTDKVMPGVRVNFRTAEGLDRHCVILGEWDRDEALDIVSCRSRLALAFIDKTAGSVVQIPMVGGEESATITSIEPLDETIRTWIKTVPAAPVLPDVAE